MKHRSEEDRFLVYTNERMEVTSPRKCLLQRGEEKKKKPNDNLVVEFLSVIQESLWKHCKLCLYSLAIGSYKLSKTADSDGLMSENCLAMEHFSVIFLRLYKHTPKLWSSVFIRSQKVLKWPAQFPEAKAFSLVINFISWLSFSD